MLKNAYILSVKTLRHKKRPAKKADLLMAEKNRIKPMR